VMVQRFDSAEGELDDPFDRTLQVPVIDWDGAHEGTEPDGAIRIIVARYVIPWLARHGVTDVDPADQVPWSTEDILRSSWVPLPEDD
jgi:hypothetical protein